MPGGGTLGGGTLGGGTLGIVLASAEPGRVHAAFSMAAAGAAVGRRVLLLATGSGVQALAAGAPFDPAFEACLHTTGVATCAVLRDVLAELDVLLMACDAALRVENIPQLHPGVRVAGMATFLAELGAASVISF